MPVAISESSSGTSAFSNIRCPLLSRHFCPEDLNRLAHPSGEASGYCPSGGVLQKVYLVWSQSPTRSVAVLGGPLAGVGLGYGYNLAPGNTPVESYLGLSFTSIPGHLFQYVASQLGLEI